MDNQKKVWNRIAPEWHEFKKIPAQKTTEFLQSCRGRILDLGSGSGRHLTHIAEGKMYLTDFSPEMIKLAEGKAKAEKIPAEFFVCPLDKLPFGDGEFDGGIWNHSLYCIPDKEKREMAVKECYRVLKDGAEVLVSVWNKNSKRYVKSSKEKMIAWQDKGKRYYYLFDEDEIHGLFKDCGFEIVKQMNSEVNISFVAKK